jgi:uncharacterized protein (TIRG00374 family)
MMENVKPERRGKIPSWALQALGYSVSAGCLAWVLRGYQFSDLVAAIRSLDWRWVILAIASDLAVYVCHGWRWNTLLGPVVRLRLWRTVQAIYIGLFANEVLPLRTGELIRCYLLAHWNNLRLSLSLASAAVERMIDGFWMLGAFLITAGFVHRIPREITLLVQLVGALLIASAAVLMWIVLRKREAHAVLSESRWSATARHVVEGLHLMGNWRSLGKTSLISLLYLLLQMFSIYALLRGDAMDLSFWQAAGILTIIRLATVVPNAPGNLGVANAACVLALHLFDVEIGDAKTFSMIMFAALTAPLLAGGAIATALTGLDLGELHKRARGGVRASHPAPAESKGL